MSIFANNITPSAPKDISWNNVCYDIFTRELYKKLHGNTWLDYVSGHRVDVDNFEKLPWNKSDIKRKLLNMRRLPKAYVDALQTTIDKIYSKYGVWTKWKVQMSKNGRIKSIYFVKFC